MRISLSKEMNIQLSFGGSWTKRASRSEGHAALARHRDQEPGFPGSGRGEQGGQWDHLLFLLPSLRAMSTTAGKRAFEPEFRAYSGWRNQDLKANPWNCFWVGWQSRALWPHQMAGAGSNALLFSSALTQQEGQGERKKQNCRRTASLLSWCFILATLMMSVRAQLLAENGGLQAHGAALPRTDLRVPNQSGEPLFACPEPTNQPTSHICRMSWQAALRWNL